LIVVIDEAALSPWGQARAMNLPAGLYKVLGRVATSDVLPFYGEQTYNVREECATRFYVGAPWPLTRDGIAGIPA
jgi:hypothetical protein